MSASHPHELQIIQAFSTVTVPERILRDSNVKELIRSMIDEQDKVQKNAGALDKARKEKNDGNIIGNWWNDRGDKVQEAQLDLSTSIGNLTQKSSQLLVVNTAISKVLSDQQTILLTQQDLLKQQSVRLEAQNQNILDQQLQLAQQQQAINAANEGLLNARGVTQEQAQKLVGCVVRVTQAEQKIDAANAQVRADVTHRLDAALAQCADSVAAADGRVAGWLDAHADTVDKRLDTAATQVARDLAAALAGVDQAQARFDAAAAQVARDMVAASAETAQAQDAHARTFDAALAAQARHLDEELAQAAQRHAGLDAALSGQLHAHAVAQEKRLGASEQHAASWRSAVSARFDQAQQDAARAAQQQESALTRALAQADTTMAAATATQRAALQAHGQAVDARMAQLDTALAGNGATLATLATQLAQLVQVQAHAKRSAHLQRLATGGAAGVAVLSLGWQLVKHFA